MLYLDHLLLVQFFVFVIAAPHEFEERAAATANSGSIFYALQDIYQGDTFFDMFTFVTGNDPTGGFVEYALHAWANVELHCSRPTVIKVEPMRQLLA
jgi:hypothetical protein